MNFKFDVIIEGHVVVTPYDKAMTEQQARELLFKHGKNCVHGECDISNIRDDRIIKISSRGKCQDCGVKTKGVKIKEGDTLCSECKKVR